MLTEADEFLGIRYCEPSRMESKQRRNKVGLTWPPHQFGSSLGRYASHRTQKCTCSETKHEMCLGAASTRERFRLSSNAATATRRSRRLDLSRDLSAPLRLVRHGQRAVFCVYAYHPVWDWDKFVFT